MKPKTSALNRLKDTARELKEQAGRVNFHIVSRRVTHTVESVKRLVNHITTVRKELQDDKDFFKMTEFALFQSQVGPTEIRLEKEGKTMFVQGTFDIAMLREFFVVNEPEGMITISVEGPDAEPKIKKEFASWTAEPSSE